MKAKKTLINLIISVAALLLVLILMEAGARVYNHFGDYKIELDNSRYEGYLTRIEGYRIEKRGGVTRVLVLGDSIAFGDGITRDETFSKKLEARLNEQLKPRSFEVINTGFPGIDTMQELNIFLNKGPFPDRPKVASMGFQGLAYKPDLLILQYTISNDAMYEKELNNDSRLIPHGVTRFDGTSVRRVNMGPYALPLPVTVDKFLTQHSKFYLFFLTRYHRLLTNAGLRDEVSKIKMMYEENRLGWLRTRYAIKRIGEVARAYGIPAVMVIWATSNEGAFADLHHLVGNVAQKNGFAVLDMAKEVAWPEENFAVSITDGHPNARAHEIAADAIFNFITKKGFLK